MRVKINGELHGNRLSVARCAGVGAIVLGVIYGLCWLAEGIGDLSVSHMFLSLFASGSVVSIGSGLVGLLWAIAFGAFTGAVTALAYNALGVLER